ncbi:nucleotidyltransferase domain-containing protein [Actinospica robiniae]|uniref:nucleotidyltransferase domain-containing protein n=1 Tax=Actinospica robiniae TaxID=304901 RepID=UPI00041A18E9|nr:hypothetical protein [Actinospica robiniae]
MSEAELEGGVRLSAEEIAALDGNWAHHWTPSQVARLLAEVAVPWYVAAGWALDLFRGKQTRKHGDLEIAVPANRFAEIRARFDGYAFDAVSSGRLWRGAAPEVIAATHQTWLRDPRTDDYLLDVFREPHDGDAWICRHDPTIRLPYDAVIRHSADGIPYLAPEFVLLFKSKQVRPKDQADFEETLPHLDPNQRATLTDLLARVHPGHAWLDRL